jgi:hypothetical protein
MSELERRTVAVDRDKERGLALTPEERAARRSNRRWLLGLTIFGIAMLGAALIASAVANDNEPTGPKLTAPPGYRVISDSYFAYVVPGTWTNNPGFTDQAGDVDTSGPSGWAGERRGYLATAPALGEAPPSSLEAFGMPRPEPFQLTGGHPLTVKGAATAYEYTATRPGGWAATVIDAYDSRAGVELWLMIEASPDVTTRIVSSLQS